MASILNVAHMNCQVATPKLVEDIFRSCQPGGTGLGLLLYNEKASYDI